jgi:non-heme chloroperoxidase
MMTRRVLLGSALVAASALPMSGITFGQGQSRTTKIQAKDGTSLFVKDTGGAGRAVVMTHAWPLNADIWDHQAAQLAQAGFRVITYDRRGFGRSDQPTAGYTFDVLADDLAAVIEQTGVRDATIVGYSMGGGEVVRYFSRHKGPQCGEGGSCRRRRILPAENREQSARHRWRRVRRHQARSAQRPQSLSCGTPDERFLRR